MIKLIKLYQLYQLQIRVHQIYFLKPKQYLINIVHQEYMNQHYLIIPKFSTILLLWICVLFFVRCPLPGMMPSGRYISAGMFQITSTNVSQTYTVSLGSYPKTQPTYDIALSMSSLHIQFNNRSLALELNVQSTAMSSFVVSINNTNGPSLKALTINYISKQPSYVDAFYIKTWRSPNYNQNIYVATGGAGFRFVYSAHNLTIQNIGSVMSRTFLSGFNIISTNNGSANDFDFMIYRQTINATHYVTRFSTSYDPYTINFYQIVAVFYDMTATQNNKLSDFVQLEVGSGTDSTPLKFTDAAGFITNYNVFMGLTIFHVKESATNLWVHYNSVIVNNTLMTITTNNNINGKWMRFQCILILSWSCTNPSLPVFDMNSKTCVTSCTLPNYPNPSTGLCATCGAIFPNCNSCNYNGTNTTCTGCASTYGLNNTGLCESCTNQLVGCQQCQLKPTASCTTCSSNYYFKTAGVCELNCALAHANCSTCQLTNGTVECLTCLTNFIQVTPNVCSLNCSIAHFHCATCILNTTVQCQTCRTNYKLVGLVCELNCSIADANCQTCILNTTVQCSTCMTNYKMVGLTCQLNCTIADVNCQTCSLNGTVQCNTCISNYRLTGLICQVDCSIVDRNCLTCILNATTVQCTVCMSDYKLVGQTCELNCSVADIKCQTCSFSSSIQCLSCIAPYQLIDSACVFDCTSVDPNCQTCSLSGQTVTCDTCIANYKLVGSTCVVDCSIGDVNCQTCSYDGRIVTCSTCMTNYYINQEDNTCKLDCSISYTNCLICSLSGSTIICDSCQPGRSLTASPPCSSCDAGYFNSSNVCTACSPLCAECQIASNNCTKCQAVGADKYYLAGNVCVMSCPANYVGDDITFICMLDCSQSFTNCYNCSMNGLTLQCNTCSAGYLLSSTPPCTSCSLGYFNNSNVCTACLSECAECQQADNNCTKCRPVNGTKYYLLGNTCGMTCPTNHSGIDGIYKCVCPFYSLADECLATCQNTTQVDVVTNKTTCTNISISINVYKITTISLQTTLIKDGQRMSHKMYLSEGIPSNITQSSLKDQMKIFIVAYRKVRLLQSQELQYNQTFQLNVYDVKFSANRINIYVQTQNGLLKISDMNEAIIMVKLADSSALITDSGTKYNLYSQKFPLTNPVFQHSYYMIYFNKIDILLTGMIICLIAFVLLIISIVIRYQYLFNEVLALILTIECFSLFRMKEFPINLNKYGILLGFAQYEFMYVPNLIIEYFHLQYIVKNTIAPVQFSMGNSYNIFDYMGGYLLILGSVLFVLAMSKCIQLIWGHRRQLIASKIYLSLQAILNVCLPKIILSSIIITYIWVKNMDEAKFTYQFWISVGFAKAFVIGYLVFFIIWVRKHLKKEFYKIHNFVRAGMIFVLIFNPINLGMILFNIIEGIMYLTDFWYFRKYKLNKILFLIQALLTFGVFNIAYFLQYVDGIRYFQFSIGSCFGFILIIKLIYICLEYNSKMKDLYGNSHSRVSSQHKVHKLIQESKQNSNSIHVLDMEESIGSFDEDRSKKYINPNKVSNSDVYPHIRPSQETHDVNIYEQYIPSRNNKADPANNIDNGQNFYYKYNGKPKNYQIDNTTDQSLYPKDSKKRFLNKRRKPKTKEQKYVESLFMDNSGNGNNGSILSVDQQLSEI